MLEFRSRPTPDDVTLFTQELSWMVAAGVPVGRAIDLLQADLLSPRMAPVLKGLRAELRAGVSLSEAMARQGEAFPETYLRLVSLAETAGTLPLVLSRLYEGRVQAQALRRKIGSAMVYPGFLVCVALAAVALIALTVVPQLRSILPPQPLASGGDAAIRRLIALSDGIAAHGLVFAALALGVLTALVWTLTRPGVQTRLADLATPIPGIGPLIQAGRLATMTRTLAMLAEAGLPLAEALRLTRRTTPPSALARTLEAMEQSLRSGEDVTRPLQADRRIPPLLSSLIKVGQETGNLGQSLAQAAHVFDEKTRLALDRALVLLEPAIILLISAGVGSLIYVVIGAMISVNDLFI
jgi:general secretion pathway protein F